MSMVEKETKVVNENKMMVNMTKEASRIQPEE